MAKNPLEHENIGENYCDKLWQEILKENKTDSFWRAVASRKVKDTTGAQILSKWRICPVVEPHPQLVLQKNHFGEIEKMLNELNTAEEITEDDVTKLTQLIFDEIPVTSFKNRNTSLRLKESISTYISTIVKLNDINKDTGLKRTGALLFTLHCKTFFGRFKIARRNSVINPEYLPTLVTPDIAPDFCSSNKRPFLVAEYGVKRESATHEDLFKLLQTMQSIIRQWQIDHPKRQYFDYVYGLLIGADVVTVFEMSYNYKYNVYNCNVFLAEDADRWTFTLSTSIKNMFMSLNSLLAIMFTAITQDDWDIKPTILAQPAIDTIQDSNRLSDNICVNSSTSDAIEDKKHPRNDIKSEDSDLHNAVLRKSFESPSRLSDNIYINSSTSDASEGDLAHSVEGKKPSSNNDDSKGSDDDRHLRTVVKTHTNKKQIKIEELYTVNRPELLIPSQGMFVVLAQLTKHARKVIQYYGDSQKFLAKLDLHKSPVEVLALKCIGSDNKKFIHPWVTELIDGVHVTLFEWKENKIHEARSNIAQVQRITKQLLKALVDMHTIGICHGDVKFDNVIDTGSQAYLVDFNLAYEPKVYQPTLCGTLGYRAPECVKRNFYSQKADIYAFGICVIEVPIGKPIYSFSKRKRDELKIVEWIRDEILPLLIERDEKLHKFVSKCLEEDENLRPTATELLQDEFFSEQSVHKDSKVRQPLGDVTNKVY